MGIRRNILLKRTVIINLVLFSLLITAGIALIFRSSEARDARHISFVSLAGDVESDILQAQILLDEIIFREEYDRIDELQNRLNLVEVHLAELDSLIQFGYTRHVQRSSYDFSAAYDTITSRLDHFEAMLENQWSGADIPPANILLSDFNRFSLSYKWFGTNLPGLLFMDNSGYRMKILGIVFLNLLFLALAGFLIIRLINRLILADRILVRQTLEVEKRERERIAADLHDGLGALLSGLIIHIQVLEKEYEDDPDLKEKLELLNQISNQSIMSIEEAINNLNPSLLTRYGLVQSLEKITSRFNQLGRTQFSVDSGEPYIKLQDSTELLLFRICMELINNAMKHSNASMAEFRIFNVKREFHLLYRDNGVGFNRELLALEERKGGLYNLMQRVESLEGTCRIESEPDRGVEVEIVWR